MGERKWFLGVDGGQSSTVAVIGDETGAVRGVGRAGPCNHVSAAESRDRFLHAVGGAVREAENNAGCGEVHFEAACLGFSGGTHDKESLTKEAVKARHYAITNDAHIALTGATAGGPGIIAIAGTGSIAYGRNASGKTARAGGWGYAIGDEGGAFDLVRQALRAILRFDEGWGPATSLRDALLHATGAHDANDLVHRIYTPEYPRSRVASFAPLVDEAAKNGDTVAREILHAAAQALAMYVAAVRRQLFHRGEASQVSYIGGVFASELLRARFRLIVELEGESRVHPPTFGPATGALVESYRMGGVPVLPKDAPTLGGLRVRRRLRACPTLGRTESLPQAESLPHIVGGLRVRRRLEACPTLGRTESPLQEECPPHIVGGLRVRRRLEACPTYQGLPPF